MSFRLKQKILFKHCDPAGIVFYPRNYEILNDCVEAFFDSVGFAFETLHISAAVPTVEVKTRFLALSHHGDQLDLVLEVLRVGKSSLDLSITAHCQSEVRLTHNTTLVHVDTSGNSSPWSDAHIGAFGPHLKTRIRIVNTEIFPDCWAPAKGYANGILTKDGQLFVGGQIGWTAEQVFETTDFIEQMEQALRNILAVVEKAGGQATDITRLTWYVTDKKEYLARQREVGQVYVRVLGKHFPAMTMVVVSALVEDEALIEIEATAVLTQ